MNFDYLVTHKENIYFGIMLIISILLYIILFISIIGIGYLIFIGICLFIGQGITIGEIKRNSIEVNEKQFIDIYEKITDYSIKLRLDKRPKVYIMQSGGLLNAFAMRFLFSDIVVLYSDIIELAYEQGEDAVNFVIAHELAHIKRKHLSKTKYIILSYIIPFLGGAYSRACEITCDRIATYLIEKVSIDAMLLLSSGKKLYKKVNTEDIILESKKEMGFWGWCAEICSTHPSILTRIKNIDEMKNIIS